MNTYQQRKLSKSITSLVLPMTLYVPTVSAAPILEEMVLHTMVETTASVFTTLADYATLNPDGVTNGTAGTNSSGISWTGTYSDTGWSYSGSGFLGGAALSMDYTGVLSGTDGTDIMVTATGTGFLGTELLTMNGLSTWLYDVGSDDYLSMDFSQETKIGSASWWGWVLGAELVAGVGAGIVSGVIAGTAVTVGTGGVAAPAGVGAGIKVGAIAGAAATVATTTISNNAKSILAPAPTPAPTPTPTKPTTLATMDLFTPSQQITLVTDDGHLYGDDPTNSYRSTGIYSAGLISGTTIFVPEPSTLLLMLAGLVGCFSLRKKRQLIEG